MSVAISIWILCTLMLVLDAAQMRGRKSGLRLPDLSQARFPKVPLGGYDLVVIGSGPGGESAAVHAAKLGAKVAVIEKKSTFGGPTGLTSKAVREAAKRICKAVDQVGGDRRKQVKNLWKRSFPMMKTEAEVLQAVETRDRLRKNGCDLFVGSAILSTSDVSDMVVRVSRSQQCIELVSKHVVIATGSRANRPESMRVPVHSGRKIGTDGDFGSIDSIGDKASDGPKYTNVAIPFTKGKIVCATEMGNLAELPKAVAVIGGGVIAVEYATVLAEMGIGVSLICKERQFLPFLEREIRDVLRKRMERNHILFVDDDISYISIEERGGRELGTAALESTHTPSASIFEKSGEEKPNRHKSTTPDNRFVRVALAPSLSTKEKSTTSGSGIAKRPVRLLKVDLLLYSGGRDANSEGLGCDDVGIRRGKYGRILVDPKTHLTSCALSSVFAIGDVIGPPGLASTAQQQGRSVAESLFGQRNAKRTERTLEKHSEEEGKPSPDIVAATTATASDLVDVDYEYDMDVDFVEEDDFFLQQYQLEQEKDPKEGAIASAAGEKYINKNLFGSLTGDSAIDTPLTLWTIPEVASVGLSAAQAREKKNIFPDVIEGHAYFKDMARGRLSGDSDGMLKIVASTRPAFILDETTDEPDPIFSSAPTISLPDTERKIDRQMYKDYVIIGVHIVGEGANELIQLGSILVHSGATLEEVSRTPFAAVTLSGLYQMACDDALYGSSIQAR